MKAYPNLQIVVSDMGQVRAVTQSDSGMDLRDYFAAKAMQALLTANGPHPFIYTDVTDVAYDLADQMMKARSN